MAIHPPRNHNDGGPATTTTTTTVHRPSARRKLRSYRLFMMVSTACILFLLLNLLTQDQNSAISRVLTLIVRRLCMSCKPQFRDNYEGYWEMRYPQDLDYFQPRPTIKPDPSQVAYVVTMSSCPEERVDGHVYPGHAYYDAAAILKYNIEQAHDNYAGTFMSYTFYAIVHPDAIYCMGPDGNDFDRVAVLEDLGYWVLVWGGAIHPDDVSSNYIYQNIESDITLNDLASLNAYRIDKHDLVVMVDFTTLMLKAPIDIYQDFINNQPTKEAMYVMSYAESMPTDGYNRGIHSDFFVLKPSNDTFHTIKEAYEAAAYDVASGWGGTGITGFVGDMGTRGFLTYYYRDQSNAIALDNCVYSNTNDDPHAMDGSGVSKCRDGETTCEDCRDKSLSDVYVAQMKDVCGNPWDCWYDENWPADSLCIDFHKRWYQERLAFETNYMDLQLSRTGAFHPEVFLGFCSQKGWQGYTIMLRDIGTCIGELQEKGESVVIPGVFQTQIVTMKAQVWTGNGNSCASGTVTIPTFQPPFNIAVVIDNSGSAYSTFGGTPVADMNADGKANTILDAEISSILQLIQALIDDPELDNNNVNIGVISFTTTAVMEGSFPPADPNDPTKINPDLESNVRSLRALSYTNFDDALDKAIDYFAAAATGRTNVLFFLSDGLPNICGEGDNENCNVDSVVGNNNAHATNFDSELAILDSYQVIRHAIGVGSGSQVSAGSGLDKIDNTDGGAQQVTTTDALVESLTANPVDGEVMSFTLTVNGVAVAGVDKTAVRSGPTGFSWGAFTVSGMDSSLFQTNTITATLAMDIDKNLATTDDQYEVTISQTVTGSVSNWLDGTT